MKLATLFTMLILAAASMATARDQEQDRTVLVELFSSQGCSSCPPADQLLSELATRDDVIALAMHVDYWDYIGWKDSFASPAYTERQRAYAHAEGRSMVYTPEMIINGADDVMGTHPKDVADLIDRYTSVPSPVELKATRRDGTLSVHAVAKPQAKGNCTVRLVRYRPEATVDILRGENAGRTLTYTNVAAGIEEVAQWDMGRPLDIEVPFEGDLPGVVIVQMGRYGPVQAVARAE